MILRMIATMATILGLPALVSVPRGAVALLFGAPASIAGPFNTGSRPHRRALGELARGVRYCRRDFRRWNGVRSHGEDGHPARCRTNGHGGADSATDDGRDEIRLKQADPSASVLSRIGVVCWYARSRLEPF